MFLRKINAGASLVTTAMLLNHAIAHAVWMLSGGRFSIQTPSSLPWILFGLMILHAIISILLAILGHKGAEKRECKGYSNLNKQTYIQRFSGVVLIPLTVLHVLGTVGIVQPPQLVHAILPPIFFAIVLMHTAISTRNAFITLGIGNAKAIKIIDVIMKMICGTTLIADVVGFSMYV